jgi:DNA-binding GntR family transcriptional regulator
VPLREVRLAEAFGVSRNTIREALAGLEREGLVRHVPHRGAQVPKLSDQDVNDLYRVRAVLECAGIAAASDNAETIEALGSEVDALERAAASHDPVLVLDHDFAFHRRLVNELQSHRLDAFFETVQRELRLALIQLDARDPTPQVDEHRMILEELRAGRPDRASRLLLDHLETARKRVSRSIGAA